MFEFITPLAEAIRRRTIVKSFFSPKDLTLTSTWISALENVYDQDFGKELFAIRNSFSKYENYKKIPFSDLDQSFFPKNFKLNNFSLNSCYLFIEDENDVYNPKLNLKIQFHPPNECSNVSILIAKIKEKLK